MSTGGIRLVGEPRRATLADYARAAEELEAALSSAPGVRAVYAYGGIRAPGISDIDRLAVVDDLRHVPDIWPSLSQETRRLAMHGPALVDAATFSRHRLFAHLSDLHCVSGEPIELEHDDMPVEGRLLSGVEGLMLLALRSEKWRITRRVKVRPFLCELGNLALDLDLSGIGRSAAPDAWQVSDTVNALRQGWWDVDPGARLREVRELLGSVPAALWQALLAVPDTGVALVPEALPLRGAWRNVTLVPGPRRHRRVQLPAPALPRRLGEARWRSRARTVAVPAVALAVLAVPRAAASPSRRERDALVARYAAALSKAPGYSSIGLAATFVRAA